MAYPRLNQNEWDYSLENPIHNLDSLSTGVAKKSTQLMAFSKIKLNLSEYDSENDATEFPKFIVLELQEKYFWLKCLHSW